MRKDIYNETKFKLGLRNKQHMKDVQYNKMNNAIAKKVEETVH